NDATVNLIKGFESFVPSPKPDPVGLLTIGFGHKCQQSNCKEVTFPIPMTQSTASQLLANDAMIAVNCLHKLIPNSVKLNDNQFGALSSFAFNAGCGTFQKSTLLQRLKAGEDPNTVAAQELPKFRLSKGKVLSGLVRRRAQEVQLFQTPSSVIAHPLC
ncbi:glycoside hydrolase family 24 protein, partial [Panaeolus papilionaceus]